MTTLTKILPEAREVRTDHGSTVLVEARIPATECHGGVRFDGLVGPVGRGLAELAGADLAVEQDLGEAVFLDVESTGLGAGAGTYAFLVGLARITDGEVVLRQHFLRGPEQEAAWVDLLARDLDTCGLLVTFNGRSFDVPLLHTRFIMQRRSLPILDVPHLDLMRPARRLWRHHLPSCALVSLEQNLLDLHREGDIPGREIPGIYSEYLTTGDAAPLAPVVSHNALDVLSMISLAIRIRDLLDDHRQAVPDHPAVWLGLGRCHEQLGARQDAEHAYTKACDDSPARNEALRRLSGLYKRDHRWDQAEALWRRLVQQAHPDGIYPYEELAKHLEHRQHRYADALELVDVALFRLATSRATCRRDPPRVTQALQHRRSRLVRKEERGRS
jgi:uncharacterized protein